MKRSVLGSVASRLFLCVAFTSCGTAVSGPGDVGGGHQTTVVYRVELLSSQVPDEMKVVDCINYRTPGGASQPDSSLGG